MYGVHALDSRLLTPFFRVFLCFFSFSLLFEFFFATLFVTQNMDMSPVYEMYAISNVAAKCQGSVNHRS